MVDEADEANVRLVDAHPEGRRRDDDLRPSRDEAVLCARTLVRFESRVVVLGAEAVAPEATRASSSVDLRERA